MSCSSRRNDRNTEKGEKMRETKKSVTTFYMPRVYMCKRLVVTNPPTRSSDTGRRLHNQLAYVYRIDWCNPNYNSNLRETELFIRNGAFFFHARRFTSIDSIFVKWKYGWWFFFFLEDYIGVPLPLTLPWVKRYYFMRVQVDCVIGFLHRGVVKKTVLLLVHGIRFCSHTCGTSLATIFQATKIFY